MITRHIADLLYHHECVIVPGLGGFIKAYRPAQILHETHEFFPPLGSVAFNAGLAGNDGLLANYIASIENSSYTEAINKIRIFVETSFDDLQKGDKLEFAGIGDLFLNASGKIEFSPSKQVNFNADSFGLPVFFAKAVNLDSSIIPDIQPAKSPYRGAKLRRLIPETLKWAAVLAPFIAFGLWGSLSGNIVDNYVHNYTGMYSWVRSTPGKTATVKVSSFPVAVKESTPEVALSPAAILASENISFDPGMVSYSELAKNKIIIGGSVPATEAETTIINQNYFIIGGAFRDHNNALKLINTLQEQGYPASVVDTTSGGLYVVSLNGYASYKEAATQLDVIKKSGFSSSWILKKHKG